MDNFYERVYEGIQAWSRPIQKFITNSYPEKDLINVSDSGTNKDHKPPLYDIIPTVLNFLLYYHFCFPFALESTPYVITPLAERSNLSPSFIIDKRTHKARPAEKNTVIIDILVTIPGLGCPNRRQKPELNWDHLIVDRETDPRISQANHLRQCINKAKMANIRGGAVFILAIYKTRARFYVYFNTENTEWRQHGNEGLVLIFPNGDDVSLDKYIETGLCFQNRMHKVQLQMGFAYMAMMKYPFKLRHTPNESFLLTEDQKSINICSHVIEVNLKPNP
jgi:hypothetical protein